MYFLFEDDFVSLIEANVLYGLFVPSFLTIEIVPNVCGSHSIVAFIETHIAIGVVFF